MDVFRRVVLEGKEGIFTDELYKLGEHIWFEAQEDLINRIHEFEKENKILIITESDIEMLHGFDFTSEEHIKVKKRLREFLRGIK